MISSFNFCIFVCFWIVKYICINNFMTLSMLAESVHQQVQDCLLLSGEKMIAM